MNQRGSLRPALAPDHQIGAWIGVLAGADRGVTFATDPVAPTG
jgi:hypothetical protein